MAFDPLTEWPDSLAAGETWKVERQWPGYDYSTGWRVTYYFVNQAAAPFNSGICTSDGDAHVCTIPAATTASLIAGLWYFEARATLSTETVVVQKGRLDVRQNMGTIAAGTDLRSHARKMLDMLEATLEGRATTAILNYEITTGKTRRLIQHLKPEEISKLRDRYKYLVTLEERRESGRNRNVYVRFPV